MEYQATSETECMEFQHNITQNARSINTWQDNIKHNMERGNYTLNAWRINIWQDNIIYQWKE